MTRLVNLVNNLNELFDMHDYIKGMNFFKTYLYVCILGSEWDYVILSTVRSLSRVETEKNPTYGWRKKHLGFIVDENQMNVALTRARKGLIIVGESS